MKPASALMLDAVVVNLEMPGMDGYEDTHIIKRQAPSEWVIILSVHAMPEEQGAGLGVRRRGVCHEGCQLRDPGERDPAGTPFWKGSEA